MVTISEIEDEPLRTDNYATEWKHTQVRIPRCSKKQDYFYEKNYTSQPFNLDTIKNILTSALKLLTLLFVQWVS